MRIKKTETVKLADLHVNLFVRKVLDQDHALYLGELISAGVEMNEPIEVTEQNGLCEIVDGRHRREGYELAGVSEVKVKVLEFDNEVEMIAYAYRKNTGGSKLPTTGDTDHTVALLLQRKESMKSIAELLNIPVELARKYATEIKSRMNRQALQNAMHSVITDGLTITKSAEMHGVDIDKLKEILSGKRKKHKVGVGDFLGMLSASHRSLGLKITNTFRKLFDKFEDGDVTEDQFNEILKRMDKLQKRHARSLVDVRARFKLLTDKNPQSKMAKAS